MSPMVIFQTSLSYRDYTDGVPGSWLYATSESGFIDGDLFFAWFRDVFVHECGKHWPVLLVIDNHDRHINLPPFELASAKNIILLGLPSHTTHIVQPLDVGDIGPVKQKLSSIVTNFGFLNPHSVIGKAKFPAVLNYALDQITPPTFKHAFQHSGIYHVD
jgi:hypothetical protein